MEPWGFEPQTAPNIFLELPFWRDFWTGFWTTVVRACSKWALSRPLPPILPDARRLTFHSVGLDNEFRDPLQLVVRDHLDGVQVGVISAKRLPPRLFLR